LLNTADGLVAVVAIRNLDFSETYTVQASAA
jgi:hypothetical protein